MQPSIIKLADYKQIASQVKKGEIKVTPEEIERLRLEKERLGKEKARQEILEKISGESQADIPQDSIEKERDLMLDNLKRQVPQILQITYEDYLKRMNKNEKEMSDFLLSEARKRITSFLVLKVIAEKENIQVSEEEVKNFLSHQNQNIDQEEVKEYAKEVIRNEKTLQFLENL